MVLKKVKPVPSAAQPIACSIRINAFIWIQAEARPYASISEVHAGGAGMQKPGGSRRPVIRYLYALIHSLFDHFVHDYLISHANQHEKQRDTH